MFAHFERIDFSPSKFSIIQSFEWANLTRKRYVESIGFVRICIVRGFVIPLNKRAIGQLDCLEVVTFAYKQVKVTDSIRRSIGKEHMTKIAVTLPRHKKGNLK